MSFHWPLHACKRGRLGLYYYIIKPPKPLWAQLNTLWIVGTPKGMQPIQDQSLGINKRFDNFIMLVLGQGSIFHIAAGSHPVTGSLGVTR